MLHGPTGKQVPVTRVCIESVHASACAADGLMPLTVKWVCRQGEGMSKGCCQRQCMRCLAWEASRCQRSAGLDPSLYTLLYALRQDMPGALAESSPWT